MLNMEYEIGEKSFFEYWYFLPTSKEECSVLNAYFWKDWTDSGGGGIYSRSMFFILGSSLTDAGSVETY